MVTEMADSKRLQAEMRRLRDSLSELDTDGAAVLYRLERLEIERRRVQEQERNKRRVTP